jgi:hypothetical protein
LKDEAAALDVGSGSVFLEAAAAVGILLLGRMTKLMEGLAFGWAGWAEVSEGREPNGALSQASAHCARMRGVKPRRIPLSHPTAGSAFLVIFHCQWWTRRSGRGSGERQHVLWALGESILTITGLHRI